MSKPQFFLQLYLQFYYISVAVTLFRVRSTWYGVRGPHNFWGVPVAQQPLPSLVLNLLLQCTTVRTVRTACICTSCDHGPYGSTSSCISQCPVHYSIQFYADIFIQSGAISFFSHNLKIQDGGSRHLVFSGYVNLTIPAWWQCGIWALYQNWFKYLL